jgi:hypothetical protein
VAVKMLEKLKPVIMGRLGTLRLTS